MDSRQKTSGMTPKSPVIPAIFWWESMEVEIFVYTLPNNIHWV